MTTKAEKSARDGLLIVQIIHQAMQGCTTGLNNLRILYDCSTKLTDKTVEDHSMSLTRTELVARMTKAGELEISGHDQKETDSYFDTERFQFHGPGGFESNYSGLTQYFASLRAAFDDRSIRRGIIVVEGLYMACQTWIEGRFVREFTHSPVGLLAANGQKVIWDLSNIFRFNEQGLIVEEWVRTDNRDVLRQLGAEGR